MHKVFHKIIIPLSPDSINKVTKYGKTDGDVLQLKKKWERIMISRINELHAEGSLPERFRGVIGVHFKLFFEFNRTRDDDNYTLMCKGILDAFVRTDMIEDDNNQFVQDNGRRLSVDPERPRVEVHIVEKIPDDRVATIGYKKHIEEINYVLLSENETDKPVGNNT